MSDRVDIEPILDGWLAEGVDILPDHAIEAVLATVEQTSQRRTWRAPWRTPNVMTFPRLAAVIGMAAIVALLIGGMSMLGGAGPLGVVATSSPSTPAASPTATATSAPTTGPSSVPRAAVRGVTPGPGVAADGTIVFGFDDGSGAALLGIHPDGSDLRDLAPGRGGGTACCAVLSSDGRLVAAKPDGSRLPSLLPLSDTEQGETWPDDTAPGLDLRPGAWSGADFAFDGASVEDATRDQGIYLSLDNGGGMLLGEIVRLTTPPTGRVDIPLSFSPDGSQLLFLRTTAIDSVIGDVGDLYVVDKGAFVRSGSGAVTFAPHEPRRLNPEGIWVISSDAFGAGASWSPDGARVAFAGFDGTADAMSSVSRAYVVDVATGQGSSITAPTSNMTSARWSPDGAWIAIDRAAPGGQIRQVSLVRPDGSDFHEIVSLALGSCCAQWSPDSTRLLAQGEDGNGAGLFIIEADGSGYSPLVTVDSAYELRWYGWAPSAGTSTP